MERTSRERPSRAVGILLLREDGSVYLRQMPPGQGSPEEYGFPWCVVGQDDCSGRALRRCGGLTASEARRILGHRLSPQSSLGHWFAAARKTFETTGGYFATDHLRGVAPGDGASLGLLGFLEARDLVYDLQRLVYFARWWIRGPGGALYDTRLYLVGPWPMGEPGLPSPQSGDLWITSDEALSLWRGKRLALSFCTFSCLRALADFDAWEPLISELRRVSADG